MNRQTSRVPVNPPASSFLGGGTRTRYLEYDSLIAQYLNRIVSFAEFWNNGRFLTGHRAQKVLPCRKEYDLLSEEGYGPIGLQSYHQTV